jgi:metal-dependent amidase/aminoacylase/carboxypeptidase family protein
MLERVYQLISEKVSHISTEIVEIRRNIYMYPELSGDERRTSQLAAEKLRLWGKDVQTHVGGYGVVGLLNGHKQGETIAWRADMDACAMQDSIDTPYKSKIDGIKHVCGHDAHTAIALGIAETLASLKDDLQGTIKFIFQPYEEGTKGAARMIQEGVLDNPRPRAVYGLHVTNWGLNQSYLRAGQLSINYGAALFGRYVFKVIVKVNRENIILPTEQEVVIYYLKRLNRYHVKCEKASQNIVDFNIIEKDTVFSNNEIHVKASFRIAQMKYIDEILEELHRIIQEYQEHNHYDVVIEPLECVPPVYNDERESEDAYLFLKQRLEDNAVPIRSEFPPHGMDDFALFQHELASGLFFFLGMANIEKGITVGMHHPNFDIDEACLAFGIKTMSMFLFHVLQSSCSAS